MKRIDEKWFVANTAPVTIWSPGSIELIPERTRRLITFIVPAYYVLMMFFGIAAAYITLPVFDLILGTLYGTVWGTLVALASGISIIALVFRLRLEIYSAIVLSTLLVVYIIYLVYYVVHDPADLDLSRVGVAIASLTYLLLPGWRILDIVLEIRKTRQRQLYAEHALGGADDDSNDHDTSTTSNN